MTDTQKAALAKEIAVMQSECLAMDVESGRY